MQYTKEMYKPVLWESIGILDLSDNLITKLERQGIWSIADLVTRSFGDLMRISGIGIRTLDKIDVALMQHDVSLQSDRWSLLRLGVKQGIIVQFNKRQMRAAGCL